MKIAVKKKYPVGIAGFVSVVLGLVFLQRFWIEISQMSFSDFILPTVFVLTTLYTIFYLLNLKREEKIIDEVSRDAAKNNPEITESIKTHLWERYDNESYTLNIISGKVKFTSSWVEQAEVEKIKSNKYIPEVIKKEFIKRT